jgi:hypothetical protein
MLAALSLLADDDDSFGVVFACIFLLIVVIAGGYAVLWLRRRFWGADDGDGTHVGFTLGDLRQLHKSGQLSTEEYEKAKEKIVAAAKRAAERDVAGSKPAPQQLPPEGQ